MSRGSSGNDQIWGGPGDDSVLGESGNDLLNGGTGADFLSGSSGNDIIDALDGATTDTINCGDGFDIVAYDTNSGGSNADNVNVSNCERRDGVNTQDGP